MTTYHDDLSITVKVDGKWQPLGDHENCVLTASSWGSDRATFDVTRDPSVVWPDLAADSQIVVEVAGVRVWRGRIKEAVGVEDRIAVDCEGLHYHLDDKPVGRLYVHDNLDADWLASNSSLILAQGKTEQYTSGWRLVFPNGVTLTAGDAVGIVLDLGFEARAKRVVMTWQSTNNSANTASKVYASDDLADYPATPDETLATVAMNGGASGTASGTAATARRTVAVLLTCTTGTSTGADIALGITSIKVFGDTAWESGGSSILKASDIIRDIIGVACPLLSTDTSQITVTTTNIKHFDAHGYRTAREIITLANDADGRLVKVDVDGRVVYKAWPTAPRYHVGAWSDYEPSGFSLTSTAGVVNSVIVRGKDQGGRPVEVERTQSVAALTRQGETKRMILDAESTIDTTQANAIGDSHLANHRTVPFKGTVTVAGHGSVRGAAGDDVHPAWLLRDTGERLQVDDLTHPEAGATRVGTIVAVTYGHGERQARIDLDNSRGG